MLEKGTSFQSPSSPAGATPPPSGFSFANLRSLRLKISLVVALTVILMIGLLSIPLETIVMQRFVELEQATLLTNLTRADEALAAQLTGLSKSVRDYSAWDGTYEFMDTLSPDYAIENLDDAVMESAGINVVLIFDGQGQIVLSKTLDFGTKAAFPLPAEISALRTDELIKFTDEQDNNKGILRLPQQTILLAASPVLPSSSVGAIKGAMIFGHLLSQQDIDDLANTTKLKLNIHRLDLPNPIPPATASQLKADTKDVVLTPDTTHIQGFRSTDDLSGSPALVFQVDMDRDIYAQGRSAVQDFMKLLALGALIFAVVMILLLGSVVLARLSRLNQEVLKVSGTDGDLKQVTVHGRDELAQLSHSINQMLEQLHTSQEEYRLAQQESALLREQQFHEQSVTLDQLSTPIIPISDTVMVMPLIGFIDQRRADKILRTLLEGMSQLRTRTAIIDITGISSANPAVITLLTRMVGAVHLLGATLVITGIQAEVAQILAEHDDLIDGIATYSNLQQAIVNALRA